MRQSKANSIVVICGLLLLGPNVEATSASPTCGPGLCSMSQETPQVQRVMLQKCNSSMESYCLHGECMLVVDIAEPLCKCKQGYVGHRCAHLAMIYQPMSQEHIILTVVCVGLSLVGIVGVVYFVLKWYRKNRSPPPEKYQEVQMA